MGTSSMRFVFVVMTFLFAGCSSGVNHESTSDSPQSTAASDRQPTVAADSEPAVADDPNSGVADIETKVIDLVAEQMHVKKDKISRRTRLIEDLQVEELDFVNIILANKESFDIEIPDEEAERVKSVGDMIDLVAKHLKSKKIN